MHGQPIPGRPFVFNAVARATPRSVARVAAARGDGAADHTSSVELDTAATGREVGLAVDRRRIVPAVIRVLCRPARPTPCLRAAASGSASAEMLLEAGLRIRVHRSVSLAPRGRL